MDWREGKIEGLKTKVNHLKEMNLGLTIHLQQAQDNLKRQAYNSCLETVGIANTLRGMGLVREGKAGNRFFKVNLQDDLVTMHSDPIAWNTLINSGRAFPPIASNNQRAINSRPFGNLGEVTLSNLSDEEIG